MVFITLTASLKTNPQIRRIPHAHITSNVGRGPLENA